VTANTYASSSACERAEMACEEVLDREARQHLPSSGRFKVGGPRWGTGKPFLAARALLLHFWRLLPGAAGLAMH
jgi:hypothetical protein